MAKLDDLKEAFDTCRGPFPWRQFVRLLNALGYEQIATGKTGGSRRRYHNPKTGLMIYLDEPHDGEMKPGMVRRLRNELKDKGVL
jgi:hypothetical protein